MEKIVNCLVESYNEPSTEKEKTDDLKELLKIYIDSQSESIKFYK